MAGISPISNYGISAYYYLYNSRAPRVSALNAASQTKEPVQPVSPVSMSVAEPSAGKQVPRSYFADSTEPLHPALRVGMDPVEFAVRSRIQYLDDTGSVSDVKSAEEVMNEAECQTCAERKYKDGSDDPGVSFKTATHIDPDRSAAEVSGHEREHVVREQAKAEREGKEVVSQSVTLHTSVCPECGKVYVAGGVTRTTTATKQSNEAQQNPVRSLLNFEAVA